MGQITNISSKIINKGSSINCKSGLKSIFDSKIIPAVSNLTSEINRQSSFIALPVDNASLIALCGLVGSSYSLSQSVKTKVTFAQRNFHLGNFQKIAAVGVASSMIKKQTRSLSENV